MFLFQLDNNDDGDLNTEENKVESINTWMIGEKIGIDEGIVNNFFLKSKYKLNCFN